MATDLPEVDLSGLVESAQYLERGSLSVQTGDLFEAVHSYKFSKIFFNPPFHLHPPRSTWERAYCGGGDSPSEHVLIRFLETCPLYLKPHGNIGLILSARERNAYQPSLHPFDVSETQSIWLPLIGRVSLLILQLRDDPYSQGDSLSDLSQVEDV